MSTLINRFWNKVIKQNGCWKWTAMENDFGYGIINSGGRGGRPLRAHRVSWEIHNGNIPKGKHILHKCDNPTCTNPEHLFLGTNYDNVQDMVKKGRTCRGQKHVEKMRAVAARGNKNGARTHPEMVPKGETHFGAIMTNGGVIKMRQMRRAGHRVKDIALFFGISNQQTSFICNRKAWKHIK